MKKNFSLLFVVKNQQWKANVRKPDGSWSTKWVPKELGIGAHDEVQAEAWIVGWLREFHANWVPPTNEKVVKKTTLETLIPRWLELKLNDPGISMNYYRVLRMAARCWILDHPEFTHVSIQHLDIEKGFSVAVLRDWINSLRGSLSTKTTIISALSTFFDDAIDEEWVSEEFVNPLSKRVFRKIVENMHDLNRKTTKTRTVPLEQVKSVLGSHSLGVENIRKVKYLLAVATGMRHREIQGLTFRDLVLDQHKIPYLDVQRQLLKPGKKPAKVYENEMRAGEKKADLFKSAHAVVGLPKRASKRLIPLHPAVVDALRWWMRTGYRSFTGRQWEPDDPVFGRGKTSLRDGQSPGDFAGMMASEVLNLDLTRLGLRSGVTFHGLRHTFATELNRLGVDEIHISRLLGHGKKTVTQQYIEAVMEPLYDAVRRLPLESLTFRPTRLARASSAIVKVTNASEAQA